jgi:hypothetical protein
VSPLSYSFVDVMDSPMKAWACEELKDEALVITTYFFDRVAGHTLAVSHACAVWSVWSSPEHS